jgi:deoxyribodipyrimidine photolyase
MSKWLDVESTDGLSCKWINRDLCCRLQSLVELNQQLVKVGSQLLVLRGNPLEIFPFLLTQWNITHVYHSIDTEPFWQWRDSQLADISKQHEVEYIGIHGHTLYDPFSIVKANNNKAPLSMTAFLKVLMTFFL